MPEQIHQNSSRDLPRWLLNATLVVIVVAAIAVTLYFCNFGGTLSSRHHIWAEFGEYVGGVLSPLFALAALFAVLYTIIIQSRELRESSEQIHKSQAVLERQVAVLARQNFESTFFHMLSLYNELAQHFRIERIGPTEYVADGTSRYCEGRESFQRLQELLCEGYIEKVNRGDFLVSKSKSEAIDIEYRKFYAVYGSLVGHYFRTIYNIIKFVDRADIDDKKFYTNLLRSQLSKYELALLFYNSLSAYGRQKLLPLIIKYDLLKHLEVSALHDPSDVDLLTNLSL